MRYFTDEQIRDMKRRISLGADSKSKAMYLMYLSRIEELDRRNDQGEDCREELMYAISQLQNLSISYVHRGKADKNDEDADAFEYENYDFQPTYH